MRDFLTVPRAKMRRLVLVSFLFSIASFSRQYHLNPLGRKSTNETLIVVLAITNAGIDVLPSIFNVVIMIAVLSVGNSAVYGSSRTLAALAEQHQAPMFLAYIDRKGRPIVSIIVTSLVGFLSYTAVMDATAEGNVFNWLLALSGLSSIFTWLTICLCHIRFRAAWKLAGHSLDELPFRSLPGIFGSWVGFIFNVLVFVAQFWIGFAPEGYGEMTTNEIIINFFEVYLAAPVIVVSYFGYKWWCKTRWVRIEDIDLTTGVRDNYEELKVLKEMDRVEEEGMPKWKRWYYWAC